MSMFKLRRKPGDRETQNKTKIRKIKTILNTVFTDKLPDKNLTKIHASSGVNEW